MDKENSVATASSSKLKRPNRFGYRAKSKKTSKKVKKTTTTTTTKTTKKRRSGRTRGLSNSNSSNNVITSSSPPKKQKVAAFKDSPLKFKNQSDPTAEPIAEAVPVDSPAPVKKAFPEYAERFEELDERAEELLAHRIRGFKKYDFKKKLVEGAMPQIKLLKRCLKDMVDCKSEFFETVSTQHEEMKELRSSLKTVTSNLVAARNELKRTKSSLEQESKTAQSLRDKIEIVTSAKVRLEKCEAELRGDLKVKSARLAIVEPELNELKAKSTQLQIDLTRVQAERDSSLQRYEDTKEEFEKFREFTQQMMNDKKIADERVSVLSSEKTRLEFELKETQDKLKRTEEELERVRKECSDTKSKLEDTMKTLQQTEMNLENAQRKIEELTETLSKTQNELKEKTEENAKLQIQIGTMTESLDNTTKERDELKAKLETATDDLEISRVNIKEKTEHNEKLQDQVKVLTSDLSSTTKDRDENKLKLENTQKELATLQHHYGVSKDTQLARLCEAEKQKEEYRKMLETLQSQMTNLQKDAIKCGELMNRLRESEDCRRKLHNKVVELRGNIRVFVRTRPFLGEESAADGAPIRVRADGTGMRLTSSEEKQNSFAFDRVFDENASQEDVFEEVSELVQSALDGYNVCVFSYGQTGSGKTWTMQGNVEDEKTRGLIPRSVEQIVESAEKLRTDGWEWTLTGQFLEIYNEKIRDLLATKKTRKEDVTYAIKTDSNGRKSVTNLRRVKLDTAEQVTELMRVASENRSVASTEMNAVSSRSHSVFTLNLQGVHKEHNIELNGSLHLVDLAGSERLSRSKAQGKNLRETKNINKSLSCLADVFMALREKRSHVPYRNSKLTYLLQECFSKDGKTMMLVNVSPTMKSYPETMCSLRFAKQVNQTELGRAKARVSRADDSSSSLSGTKTKTSSGGKKRKESPVKATRPKRTRKAGVPDGKKRRGVRSR